MKTLNINGQKVKVDAMMQWTQPFENSIDNEGNHGVEIRKVFAVVNGVKIEQPNGLHIAKACLGRINSRYEIDGISFGDSEKKALEYIIHKYKVSI